jgi:hypothetical protein
MNLALASNLLARTGGGRSTRSGRSSRGSGDIDITFVYISHNGEMNWGGVVFWLLVIAVIIGLVIWFNRSKIQAKLTTRSTTPLGSSQDNQPRSNPDLSKRLK